MTSSTKTQLEMEKELAALEAVSYVRDGQTIGLGTGTSAYFATKAIGELVRQGLQIRAVATSVKTETLAKECGIPLIDINTVDSIDVTIDGADEFTSDLTLIKGGGGALLREKIVASLTKMQLIVVDSSKKVEKLGRFPLPIEVFPFASRYVNSQLAAIGGRGKIRENEAGIFLTDQGNHILDTDWGLIEDPRQLAESLNLIEGIACHGLFIDLASRVIMGMKDGVEVFEVNAPLPLL